VKHPFAISIGVDELLEERRRLLELIVESFGEGLEDNRWVRGLRNPMLLGRNEGREFCNNRKEGLRNVRGGWGLISQRGRAWGLRSQRGGG
jgi:hypothetical protein